MRRLIEFLYTGNYQLSPDPALELLDAGTVDEGGNNTDEQDSSSTEIGKQGRGFENYLNWFSGQARKSKY